MDSDLIIVSELPPSSDIFQFSLAVQTFTTGAIRAHFPPCLCNLLYDVWVGQRVSLGYIRAHVNTPPSPSCSPGPKPCWMMGNRESWEKIKGKQSQKSPRWTQRLSNPWTCMRGDSSKTCVETKTPFSLVATAPNISQAINVLVNARKPPVMVLQYLSIVSNIYFMVYASI